MKVTQLNWSVFLLLMFIAFYGAIMASDLTFRYKELKAAQKGAPQA